MKYADFHFHPAFKTFLGSSDEKKRKNCWKRVKLKGLLKGIDITVGNIMRSQASLYQLKMGKVNLAVAAIPVFESPMFRGEIFRINNTVINLVSLAKSVKELDEELFLRIANQQVDLHEMFLSVKRHLMNASKYFHVPRNYMEIKKKKLNLIPAIEGANVFLSNYNHYTEKEVLENLDQVKKDDVPYLYLTLCHLSKNPFCTHAFGMKIIKDDELLPIGKGITKLGFKVIKKALDNLGQKPIFIDIKHMSFLSRLEYYHLLKKDYPNVPIVASHCAVNGVSYKKMPIKRVIHENGNVNVDYFIPRGIAGITFNPWSINLYDEEISIIINSGGIIGLNLDERILGVPVKVNNEFFSKAEFRKHRRFIQKNLHHYKKMDGERNNQVFRNKPIYHLCNNILHMVKVGGERVWDHLVIGSDFDGLIKPIRECKTAADFPRLKRKLIKYLPKLAEKDPGTDYHIGDIKKRVNNIMHDNMVSFLEKYY
ncbi:MAG: membrane dipeptidase [Bacteroidota bacterium]